MTPDRALRQNILADQPTTWRSGKRQGHLDTPKRSVFAQIIRRLMLKLIFSLGLVLAGREVVQTEWGATHVLGAKELVVEIVVKEMVARDQARRAEAHASAQPAQPGGMLPDLPTDADVPVFHDVAVASREATSDRITVQRGPE